MTRSPRIMGWICASLGSLAACSGNGDAVALRRGEQQCWEGGLAVPMATLGSDPAPFRIERVAPTWGAPPVPKPPVQVYRFEREPSGTTEALRAVTMAEDGKLIIAVGDRGTALVRGAAAWEREATGTEENLYAIVRAPLRPRGPINEERERRAPFIVVGARGAAFARDASGAWRAEATGTDKDLFGAYHRGTSTLAVGAGGTMVQRSPEGIWRAIPTRTAADLYAVGRCSSHICAVGAAGAIVDCIGGGGELTCIPRQPIIEGDLRAISDDSVVYGHSALLQVERPPEGVWSPPPAWKQVKLDGASIRGDEARAVWNNHSMGTYERIAVGRGGVVWLLGNPLVRQTPFQRVMVPFGVDFHGVAFERADGFLVGDQGTIVHLSVDGLNIPGACLL